MHFHGPVYILLGLLAAYSAPFDVTSDGSQSISRTKLTSRGLPLSGYVDYSSSNATNHFGEAHTTVYEVCFTSPEAQPRRHGGARRHRASRWPRPTQQQVVQQQVVQQRLASHLGVTLEQISLGDTLPFEDPTGSYIFWYRERGSDGPWNNDSLSRGRA
ncbi:hypothetical protein LENED_004855 [Lentinula edodes]|uniref:Uncharacterized protein n=1 Tax=Lentinula edodes TaxID=5353 RepID=A0A1Q3E7T1_LENED|nr:uncharacterized protein C8R40DRAFT_1234392 [Lentinula edodes]KAH7880088.1 hypothetical protein C8R40DRAFT_1234392 [Lentinula edodes]KAJ3916000.1 hypothetical protein F5877DRAFT_81285 [Lentinula edodes]GAW03154.1 hypothetical protein LENED_004855 [Lentinula edodes]